MPRRPPSKSSTDTPAFDARRVKRIVGLSMYMIDYLDREEIIRPSIRRDPGRGKRRLYSFGDVVALRVAKRLLDGGISVARLKESLIELQRTYGRDFRSTPSDFFVTDGRKVFFKSEKQVLGDLSRGGQLAFSFMIDLRQIHAHASKFVKKAKAA